MSSSGQMPIFSEGVGYGLIIGLGALFAVGMSFISLMLSRLMSEVQDSEMYMTAKHSVKVGLVASAVVSSWTIAATLLSSTTEGYLYGVSGPYWYGAGASVQIFLFAIAAIELKRKAPTAHTFLEVVRARYGPSAHIVLMCYSLFFQVFTSVNLLVGGSTLYATVTGMSADAACFLLPLGVVIYTLFGGIKATFLTDWAHTVVIYIIMLASLFAAYVTSDTVGSPGRMHELLTEAARLHPVAGNAQGSYLTMQSEGGGYIGLIFIGAGFASAVDSQLFQKAIAADPAATLPGYVIGGLCWFTIPFVLASTFGLAAAATEHLPIFPTFPDRMTTEQVTTGMAMPFAALALMGNGGVLAILIMVFMAVTSAMSSETVATAALVTYDIYKAYINPKATSHQLVRVSHATVVGFGMAAACIAVGFNHAGFSVNYLITAIGIFVDSAVVPMGCTVLWRRQSRAAVVSVPLLSSAAAVVAWLATAYTHYGEVTISSTSQTYPLVAGNMMSLCGPVVLTPLVSMISSPQSYDWEELKNLKTDYTDTTTLDAPEGADVLEVVPAAPSMTTAQEPVAESFAPNHIHTSGDVEEVVSTDDYLKRARGKGLVYAAVLCLALLILWPIPMYGTGYVFSEGFFTGWVVVLFLWAFFATITITLGPIIEGRKDSVAFLQRIIGIKTEIFPEIAACNSNIDVNNQSTPSDSKKA